MSGMRRLMGEEQGESECSVSSSTFMIASLARFKYITMHTLASLLHLPNSNIALHPSLNPGLLEATHDVVIENLAGRERRDGAPKVLLEGVVRKLEAFLGDRLRGGGGVESQKKEGK